MEKFGMSFGAGPSKKDMHDTIESQKKQLIQYQTRFKDVVRAYKSLLKEKEALEASLKVLTVSQEVDFGQCHDGGGSPAGPASITSDLPEDRCSLHSEDSLDTAGSITSEGVGPTGGDGNDLSPGHGAEPAEASGSESGISSSSGRGQDPLLLQTLPPPPGAPFSNAHAEADRRVIQLRTQLSTLTSSLATVTQEKSRMEASFQADKRNIKQELEELQARVEEEQRGLEERARGLQEQLAESRARVITQQHERAREQGDHALMLRELQTLLQAERDQRQDGELRLEDARAALQESVRVAEHAAEGEAVLRESGERREELLRGLRAAEAERRKPDPRMGELEREVSQAEDRSRDQAQAEEGRVASLEERVSELSELLGSCEQAKQRDQQSIRRLRDRLLQLDTENKTLAVATSARASGDLSMDEANLDVGALRDKMEKVKRLLLLASRRSPEQMAEIQKLSELEPDPGAQSGGADERKELRQLREEFERYKLRAQVVLKNKNAKDGCQAKELEDARDQLAELKEKYINLRIHADEADTGHRRDLEEHERRVSALQLAQRQELERAEVGHREGLLRVEAELHKQRERVAALLDEKDRELERLRAAAALICQRDSEAARVSVGEGGSGRDGGSEDQDPAAQDESGIMALRLAGPDEPTLLLVSAVAVLAASRRRRRPALRRQKAAAGGPTGVRRGLAGGRLDKLLRDQGREGANLEYLKNVIYKFLTLQDGGGRQQTLGAILTILHFSPQEKKAVLKLQSQPWWPAGHR
ncbi:hypothetical protein CRUP_008567 [Coryphaenoides rupestris]|nr:hypothetical protein CRUP_008567 [Coryphaenoides rupestris]